MAKQSVHVQTEMKNQHKQILQNKKNILSFYM